MPLRDRLTDPGWTLEDAPVPHSESADPAAATLGIDRTAAILSQRGMPRGYELALPVGADVVYPASVYPRDATRQRVIALDQ
ncbi:hypothetical protein MKK75_31135 [Methylobacterium sp. J-030]|uniref:hypothetical protein n=1 Tax=Methylobacterium sp. J-030 TaxID=2836627 RepID=UPI001FB89C95|nr:hypothetical protein [Methylobacterium sp. J-030]MCJ2073188.1 hypothetical protein [Methylobacterium sp. J-030]